MTDRKVALGATSSRLRGRSMGAAKILPNCLDRSFGPWEEASAPRSTFGGERTGGLPFVILPVPLRLRAAKLACGLNVDPWDTQYGTEKSSLVLKVESIGE